MQKYVMFKQGQKSLKDLESLFLPCAVATWNLLNTNIHPVTHLPPIQEVATLATRVQDM
jgi:hypothetical protein